MIIVTGIGGFVGSNIAEYLYSVGYRVLGTYYRRKPVFGEINAIQVDLANWDDVWNKIGRIHGEKIDAILHFAAQMEGTDINGYLKNTVNSTKNLLKLAELLNVKSFVYASSIAVYGMTEKIVNEESDRTNLTDYGMAKYICERLIQDASLENRIAIRLPRMLGPRVDLRCPWLPKLTQGLLRGERITYFNPELLYNNLAHCNTLADFIIKLMDRNNLGYETVGIGASNPMKIIDIVELLKRLTGSESELIEKCASDRNTCFLIDIAKSIAMGYEPMAVEETLDMFIKDIGVR